MRSLSVNSWMEAFVFARVATAIMAIASLPSFPAFQLTTGSLISSAQLSISYVESQGNSNDGPTTLFIHGLDSSSQTWQGVQQTLATPSVAIDCRGCGRSELGDPSNFSPDALVEDVKSLVEFHPLLRDKPFVLVGHSMGGRVAMCYVAKYPEDVSALVIEDMDIRRRSVSSNFIPNFDEERALAFSRCHDDLNAVKNELESVGYPSDMTTKWIGEGRIYEEKTDGKIWSDVNPAFRALCYRTIFDSNVGTDSWSSIAAKFSNRGNVFLMVAGIGTVCDEECIESMRQIMEGKDSSLSVKTYSGGNHSIHNSARADFMADLSQIINDVDVSNVGIEKSKT